MDVGPMLDIKYTTLHNPLIYWFAKLYDKKTREFVVPSRGRILLNEAAARHTLGLPIGSVPVPYRTDGRLEHSLAPVVFPRDSKTPTTSRVWEILKEMTDDGDIFKQIYIMYLMSTVLSPTTRNHISNRCYPIMVIYSSFIAYVSCKVIFMLWLGGSLYFFSLDKCFLCLWITSIFVSVLHVDNYLVSIFYTFCIFHVDKF
jgi:hypothetical protein